MPWRWTCIFPPKQGAHVSKIHDVTSRTRVAFKVTAVGNLKILRELIQFFVVISEIRLMSFSVPKNNHRAFAEEHLRLIFKVKKCANVGLTWNRHRSQPSVANTQHRSRVQLKCDGIRAETRFRLSAKRSIPFKSAGTSVQSTTGSRGVSISGSNAGYTMFRGSVKSTGYLLYIPVSPSLPLPCVIVCHHISSGLYHKVTHNAVSHSGSRKLVHNITKQTI